MNERSVVLWLELLETNKNVSVFLVSEISHFAPQTARECISKSLEFQDFPGEHAPRPPLDVEITQLECVSPVQKYLGSRLRSLKKNPLGI